jgi:hypothetical protein
VRGAVFVVEAEIKLKSTHNLRSGNDVKKLEKTVNFFVSRNCDPLWAQLIAKTSNNAGVGWTLKQLLTVHN